jgi:arsenate reductase (thioredoxin)
MAEGFARRLIGSAVSPYSAGSVAKGLDPYAIKVMLEAGIDISAQRSKTMNEVAGIEFDYVITLCSDADENCPFFPAKTKVIHHGFDDPPMLATDSKSEGEILIHYRRVRDEIHKYIKTL